VFTDLRKPVFFFPLVLPATRPKAKYEVSRGKVWKSFNAAERYVIMPAGKDLIMEVTLNSELKH